MIDRFVACLRALCFGVLAVNCVVYSVRGGLIALLVEPIARFITVSVNRIIKNEHVLNRLCVVQVDVFIDFIFFSSIFFLIVKTVNIR